MDLQLRDHVALITGAASGIGKATAVLFAEEGAHLVLWDINPAVTQVAEELSKTHGVRTIAAVVDVAVEAQVNAARDAAYAEFQRVDHVVHCAAIGSGKFGFPFTNLRPEDWRRPLEVNVMGMVHVAHALAPPMREARQGSFLFLASVAGQIGSQTDPPYSAAKAATINFAQCMAKDLAPHGIRVNTVCPGMAPTELNRSVWRAWYEQTPPEQRLSYEEWGEQKLRATTPLGRWQRVEDIAAMILFLSSPRASEVTGQTINVDGGFVMHW